MESRISLEEFHRERELTAAHRCSICQLQEREEVDRVRINGVDGQKVPYVAIVDWLNSLGHNQVTYDVVRHHFRAKHHLRGENGDQA